MNDVGKVFICGTDHSPGTRSECPDPVHDWPEPDGYGAAFDVAERRLRNGWHNVRCPTGCGIYGWRVGRKMTPEDVQVQHPSVKPLNTNREDTP